MNDLPNLYPRFSGAEYERRFTLVRNMMEQEGVEALLLFGGTGAAGIYYLTNHLTRSGAWLIFPKAGDSTLLINLYNHIPTTLNMSIVSDVRCYHPSGPRAVAADLRERGLHTKRIGIVGLGSTIPYKTFLTLQTELPDVDFVDLARPFDRLRWIRSEEELDWFRESARLTDLTCELLEQRIKPGLTEHDLVSIIHEACVPHDGNPTLHFITSTPMDAPERCLPWQYPTRRRLSPGDVITTEITVTYWTYASQTHRPYTVEREPNDTYRRLFDAALECFERVRSALKPGSTSEDIVAASSIIEERGFTAYDSLRGSRPQPRARHAYVASSARAVDLSGKHGRGHTAESRHTRPQSGPAARFGSGGQAGRTRSSSEVSVSLHGLRLMRRRDARAGRNGSAVRRISQRLS